MDYEQRVRFKTKPATKTNGNDERENATTGVFKLLQQKQFAEELESCKGESEKQQNYQLTS